MTVGNTTTGRSWPFGLDPARVARELRLLANQIEDGTVSVQGVTQNTRNNQDDYETKHFVVRYSEKRDVG
jgi:hypothetical protein